MSYIDENHHLHVTVILGVTIIGLMTGVYLFLYLVTDFCQIYNRSRKRVRVRDVNRDGSNRSILMDTFTIFRCFTRDRRQGVAPFTDNNNNNNDNNGNVHIV